MSGKRKRIDGRKILGLVMLSMGMGMLAILLLPGWGLIFAAFLVIMGFWNLFLC